METQEDQPDHSDDPRERDVSDQLPEEQQEGAAEGNEPPPGPATGDEDPAGD